MTPKERLSELKRELAANPASRQFYQLGELLRRDGELAEAVAILRQGLTHHPRYVAAWVSLGRALLDLKELGDAHSAFRMALDLDSQNPVAWRLLGEALLGLNQRLEALRAFEHALTLVPGDQVLEAAVASLKGELAEAQAPLSKRQSLPSPGPVAGEAFSLESSESPTPGQSEYLAEIAPEIVPAASPAGPALSEEAPGVLTEPWDLASEAPFDESLSAPPLPPLELFPFDELAEPTGQIEVDKPLTMYPGGAAPELQEGPFLAEPSRTHEPFPESVASEGPASVGQPEGFVLAPEASLASEVQPVASTFAEPTLGVGEQAFPRLSAAVAEARAAINRGDLSLAVSMLESLVQADPDNQEALDLLALVRDMMEPLPPETPRLSSRERKIAALQRFLAQIVVAKERLSL